MIAKDRVNVVKDWDEIFKNQCKGIAPNQKTKESNMQTDIEILESRENPMVIWY